MGCRVLFLSRHARDVFLPKDLGVDDLLDGRPNAQRLCPQPLVGSHQLDPAGRVSAADLLDFLDQKVVRDSPVFQLDLGEGFCKLGLCALDVDVLAAVKDQQHLVGRARPPLRAGYWQELCRQLVAVAGEAVDSPLP